MARCSGDLLPPSPPAEKAAASRDQTWQSRADDGPRNRRGDRADRPYPCAAIPAGRDADW